MSDFRKAFEYEEEKGMPGFLLVFFAMLLTFEPLLGATTMFQCHRALKDTPALGAVVLAVGSAYLLLIFATGIALRKRFRLGVTLSKVFLILRVLVMVPVYIVLFASLSRLLGSTVELGSPTKILFTRLIAPIGYIVAFSAGWYGYFLKSKKVRKLREASQQKG